MKTLNVKLPDCEYPIFIGSELFSDKDLLRSYVKGRQVLIVSNVTVAPLYLDKLVDMLEGVDCKNVILPDGEQYKNITTLNLIFDALLESRFNRQCVLIALGGGVVGDITGFAAASYQRGVDFIQIPTTLLAQVDSSVGGKTGVNHPKGKNMIGAFHQPVAVVSDYTTLDTLDDRQLIAGIAEVIKYGLINDSEFFDWIESNIDKVLSKDGVALSYLIERSCANKADVVERDEKESNIRAILNLGHTFGHAIETLTGYTQWLHGEAVGIGMLMAADMSCRMGLLRQSDVNRIRQLLEKTGLPVTMPADLKTVDMIAAMGVDKKVMDNRIRLVLLTSIGEAVITSDFDEKVLVDTIDSFLEQDVTA